MNTLRYYRCTGADGYRFSGKAVCNNGPVRGDQLEQVVWDQVQALLEEPHRVADVHLDAKDVAVGDGPVAERGDSRSVMAARVRGLVEHVIRRDLGGAGGGRRRGARRRR
ncbi:MAG: zinc ribbon domain-containing protein [Polyangiaceae bacterium]